MYPVDVSNAGSLLIYGGVDTDADQADRVGFCLYTGSVAAGSMTVRYVWAYQAP